MTIEYRGSIIRGIQMANINVSTTSTSLRPGNGGGYWRVERSARLNEEPEPLLQKALVRIQAARDAIVKAETATSLPCESASDLPVQKSESTPEQ